MRWFTILMTMTFILGCGLSCNPASRGKSAPEGSGGGGPAEPERYSTMRERMVRTQIEARGIRDPRVLAAMRKVPRHLFIPEELRDGAYEDGPVSIGQGQTISQPYIVALMTELARPGPGDRILEVGTGSGYQAAILGELAGEVDTIEIVEPLGQRAEALLRSFGYANVHCRIGDGYAGWPERAPFDAIVVTAAPGSIPEPLKEQLAVGGRLVIPVGRFDQDLVVVTRTADGFHEISVAPVRFVPMTGEAEKH